MMDTQAELNRMSAVKVAVMATTRTPGWQYVKQIANNIVTKVIQDALDEPDRELGESKRLKASALQRGFADLFNGLEQTMNFDPEQLSTDQTGFGELEDGFESPKS